MCFYDMYYLVIKAEQCTEGFMKLDRVKYSAQYIGINLNLANQIRILEEYQFNCTSTNITSVILGSIVKTVTDNRTMYPSIQLWRPGSYGTYTVVPDSERVIYYSTTNVSNHYPLNPPISVNHGELLAISQPIASDSVVRVRYKNGEINFKSHRKPFGATNTTLTDTSTTDELILVYPITGTVQLN